MYKRFLIFLLLILLLVAGGIAVAQLGRRDIQIIDQNGKGVAAVVVSLIEAYGENPKTTDSEGFVSCGWGLWAEKWVHVKLDHGSNVLIDEFLKFPRFGKKTIAVRIP